MVLLSQAVDVQMESVGGVTEGEAEDDGDVGRGWEQEDLIAGNSLGGFSGFQCLTGAKWGLALWARFILDWVVGAG